MAVCSCQPERAGRSGGWVRQAGRRVARRAVSIGKKRFLRIRYDADIAAWIDRAEPLKEERPEREPLEEVLMSREMSGHQDWHILVSQ